MADPVSFELYHDPNLCNFGQCSVLIVKALVGAFSKEKALDLDFFVIVKTSPKVRREL